MFYFRQPDLKRNKASAILTAMTVSPRKFVRQFSRFRDQAEHGEPVVIQGRNGTKFLFHRVGQAARPRRAPKPLPASITQQWDLDTPAISPEEWQINHPR
jgi:hypothetical protein